MALDGHAYFTLWFSSETKKLHIFFSHSDVFNYNYLQCLEYEIKSEFGTWTLYGVHHTK